MMNPTSDHTHQTVVPITSSVVPIATTTRDDRPAGQVDLFARRRRCFGLDADVLALLRLGGAHECK